MMNIRAKKLVSSVMAGAAMMAFACAAQAQSEQDMQKTPTYQDNSADNSVGPRTGSPSAGMMAFDLVLVRPLGLAATAIGTGLFIVNLPFSFLENNAPGQPFHKLVVDPAEYTFTRPLGQVN